MDSIIDVLIRKEEFGRINIKECFVEWGEEKLSQNPKKYIYNSTLIFHENTDMDYYKDLAENKLNIYEFSALTLEGDELDELEKSVNRGEEIKYTNDLISFIDVLYNRLSTFCFIKLRNEECIDEKHIINDSSKAIKVFIDSLQRNSPKGIVIIKNCEYV